MHKRQRCLSFILIFICISCVYVTIVQRRSKVDIILVNHLEDIDGVESTATVTKNDCLLGDLVYGNYCVITPREAERSAPADVGSVTLCTQGTVEFLHHVPVVCRRWGGPISVSVYSPADDYLDARHLVSLMQECDFCVKYWVTWHFFFQNQQVPVFIRSESPPKCEEITKERPTKRRSDGVYPINVGRNLARIRTQTPYVFSTDIELYPSLGIVTKFERMIQTEAVDDIRQVWAFPVFEVSSKFRAPMTKLHLKSMFQKRQAISFHQFRCNLCHRIPNLTQWINYDDSDSEVNETLAPLKIWTTVTRSRRYRLQFWEPFFIGTKDDPEFDIRLSWEGKQNKMQMAYEMCLQSYKFHIVENAFLVHAPGINVYNATKEKTREKFVAENSKTISIIRQELAKKYGRKSYC